MESVVALLFILLLTFKVSDGMGRRLGCRERSDQAAEMPPHPNHWIACSRYFILSCSSGSISGAASRMESICTLDPRAARCLRNSTVRKEDTFSARANEINWLIETPSSLASSLTSRWIESGNLTLNVDMVYISLSNSPGQTTRRPNDSAPMKSFLLCVTMWLASAATANSRKISSLGSTSVGRHVKNIS